MTEDNAQLLAMLKPYVEAPGPLSATPLEQIPAMPNRYGLGLFEALNIVAYAQFFGINDYSVESQCRASGVKLQDMTALVQWVNDYLGSLNFTKIRFAQGQERANRAAREMEALQTAQRKMRVRTIKTMGPDGHVTSQKCSPPMPQLGNLSEYQEVQLAKTALSYGPFSIEFKRHCASLGLDYLEALVLVVWFEKYVTPEQLSELEAQARQE